MTTGAGTSKTVRCKAAGARDPANVDWWKARKCALPPDQGFADGMRFRAYAALASIIP